MSDTTPHYLINQILLFPLSVDVVKHSPRLYISYSSVEEWKAKEENGIELKEWKVKAEQWRQVGGQRCAPNREVSIV